MNSVKFQYVTIVLLFMSVLILSCSKDDKIATLPEPDNVQNLLDSGSTPKELFDDNIPLDSLYGKSYEGGLIFYLNTTDGTGMLASMKDLTVGVGTGSDWGCEDYDISDLNNVQDFPLGDGAELGDGMDNTNTILGACVDGYAARLCRELGSDWFLPSVREMRVMLNNLQLKGHGGPWDAYWYWSSTESSDFAAWVCYITSVPDGFSLEISKGTSVPVRAARTF